jgi:hypothetical protein
MRKGVLLATATAAPPQNDFTKDQNLVYDLVYSEQPTAMTCEEILKRLITSHQDMTIKRVWDAVDDPPLGGLKGLLDKLSAPQRYRVRRNNKKIKKN